MRTGAGLAQRPDWREALNDLIGQIPFRSGEDEVHLALLFASSEYRDETGSQAPASWWAVPAMFYATIVSRTSFLAF